MDEEDNPHEKKPEASDRFMKADDFGLLAEMQDDFGEDAPFTIAGRYEVVSTLGQGGMGAVYKARDTRLDRTVAIKTILPQRLSGKEASQRFVREARALARLNHPNILTIYDHGQDDDTHFLVMELGGKDLGRLLEDQGGPLSLEQALHVAKAICRALEHAHGQGIIHRDLKPGNILVGTAEKSGWAPELGSTSVKVMDFGLAKMKGAAAITAVLAQIGTPQYMSPEQVMGRDADEESDLYALGIILYELLTAVRPFDSDNVESILSQQLAMPPVPPSAFNAGIPQGLEVLILRLLEKDPSRRPSSAGEVLKALENMSLASRITTSSPDALAGLSLLGILPARTPLVGRERELEFMKSQYEAVAAGGAGRLILVSGEPGVGKTRLVRELGVYARLRGGLYAEGRYLKEGTAPYGPIVEALREILRLLTKEELAKAVSPYGAELSQIFPELIEQVGPFPSPAMFAPEDMRQRLYDGITSLGTNLSQNKPLVLLLDDLQWAPGITLLAHVARRLGEARLLLVGAYREQEFKESSHLVRDWAELNRARLFTQVTLTPLSEEETARIVAHHFGGEPANQLKGAIHSRTRGNPFFVEEVLRSLAESGAARPRDGGWEMADLSQIGIPESLKLAVEDRISRLGEGARDVLINAAVLGQEFNNAVLVAMVGKGEEQIDPCIDRAIDARILVDRSGSGEERFGFLDDQLQEVLYESMNPRQRRRLHLRAGQAVEQVYSERLDVHLEELARHFVEGNNPEKGAEYSYQAGLKADRLYVWHRSIPYYQTALELWEEIGGHLEERARGYESLADACFKSATDPRSVLGYFEKALTLYQELGNRHKVATIHSQIGRQYQQGDLAIIDLERSFSHLHQARTILEGFPGSMALGIVYASLSASYLLAAQMSEAISWGMKAMEVGERLNNPAVLSNASSVTGAALVLAGEVARGLGLVGKGWQLAAESNLAWMVELARYFGAGTSERLKNPLAGLDWVERKPNFGTNMSLIVTPPIHTHLRGLRGEFKEAEEIYEKWRAGMEVRGQPTVGLYPDRIGRMWFLHGEWDRSLSFMEDAFRWTKEAHRDLEAAFTAWVLGELYLELGDYLHAEEALLFADRVFREGDCVRAVLPLLSVLYLRTNRLEMAELSLAGALEILRRSESWHGRAGDVYLAEGTVRAAEGQWEEAGFAYGRAVAVYRQFALKWDEAKTCYEWACSLLQKGGDEARQKAGELLRQSLGMWEEMGVKPYIERCRSRLAEMAQRD